MRTVRSQSQETEMTKSLEEASCFSGDEDRSNKDLSTEFAAEDIKNLAASGPGQSRQSSTPVQDKGIKPFVFDEEQLKAERSSNCGSKALWTDNLLSDLVDIICNDECHKQS